MILNLKKYNYFIFLQKNDATIILFIKGNNIIACNTLPISSYVIMILLELRRLLDVIAM